MGSFGKTLGFRQAGEYQDTSAMVGSITCGAIVGVPMRVPLMNP